jgi:hypothetical protein
MNTGLWNMDSGLAAARRPGMTERGGNKKAGEDGTSPAFLREWPRRGYCLSSWKISSLMRSF